MIIQSLYKFYDYLAKYHPESAVADGYSLENIKYKICLSPEGEITDILDASVKNTLSNGKEVFRPRPTIFPKREPSINSIKANVVEHRSTYIFGLELMTDEDNGTYYSDEGAKGKAGDYFEAFKKKNLEFFSEADTPLSRAFVAYLNNFIPSLQTNNVYLNAIKKDYGKSNYVFCLSSDISNELQNDSYVIRKWEALRAEEQPAEGSVKAQCGVTGEIAEIERRHDPVKGLMGSGPSPSLVSFNAEAFESYGKKQSMNGNVSVKAMQHYVKALNYLLSDNKHFYHMDDLTVVYWAEVKEQEEAYSSLFSQYLNNGALIEIKENENVVNNYLNKMADDIKNGESTTDQIKLEMYNAKFFILGLLPNVARISVKFFFVNEFGKVIENLQRFQSDLHMEEQRPIPWWRLKAILSDPNGNEKQAALLSGELLRTATQGALFPLNALAKAIYRIKTDVNQKIDREKVGLIKACLIRNYKKEISMSLDINNKESAYLSGRLFAVLEHLQRDATSSDLNQTIKDSYFASACSTPSVVFPRLVMLAQNHLSKLESGAKIYYNRMIGEILNEMGNSFPATLSLDQQGKFILGYYQEDRYLWTPAKDKKTNEEIRINPEEN